MTEEEKWDLITQERRERTQRLLAKIKEDQIREREEKIANGTWEYWRDYVIRINYIHRLHDDDIIQTEGGYTVQYALCVRYYDGTDNTLCSVRRYIVQHLYSNRYEGYLLNVYNVRAKRGKPGKRTREKAWAIFHDLYDSMLEQYRNCKDIMETIDDYDD